MNFTIVECEQRSEEWKLARLGRLTGSRAPHMMAKIKNGDWAASRRNLRMGLALEQITQRPFERGFAARTTTHGVDTEPAGLGIYEARTGYMIERTGFLSLGPIMAGCSLDGHVSDFEGIVEIKCPEPATHLTYLRSREIPEEYRWQCIHNLWVTDAQWVDFISYDPSFTEKLSFLCIRLARNESEIAAYEAAAMRFLAEVALEVKGILELEAA